MAHASGNAAPAGPPPHDGPWTEDAYLALDGGRRIELVDGSLLVAPTTDDRHAGAVASVRAAVAAALPDGLEVTGPVALRLAPGRILVPDLVVAAPRTSDTDADGADADATDADDSDRIAVRDSSDALLVIDVVGRDNGVADRWFKPQLYAGSRIPYALLVDHDGPFAEGNMLIGGRYHSYARAGAGEVLCLEEPFDLELALDGLVTAGPEARSGEPDTPSAAQPDPDQSVRS